MGHQRKRLPHYPSLSSVYMNVVDFTGERDDAFSFNSGVSSLRRVYQHTFRLGQCVLPGLGVADVDEHALESVLVVQLHGRQVFIVPLDRRV